MALNAAYDTFTMNTSTGVQTLALPGGATWTPKCIIVFGVAVTAAGYSQTYTRFMGFADASADYGCCLVSDDVVASSTGRQYFYDDLIVIGTSTAAGVHTIATIDSFDPGGVDINITDAPPSAFVFHAIFLGGADISAKVVLKQTEIATATEVYTGVGFQPQALLRFGTMRAVAPDTQTGHHQFSFGAATSSSQTWVVATAERLAQVTMTSSSLMRADRSIITIGGNATPTDGDQTLLTFDSDGWTDTVNDVDFAANYFAALALRGVSFRAGTDTQRTSTGTRSVSGVGFTPALALFSSIGKTVSTTLDTTQCRLTIGASDGTREGCIWSQIVDNIADAQVASAHVTDKALRFANADTSTIAEADCTLDADGFTLNWTTADATAREFGYLLIGEPAVTAGRPKQGMRPSARHVPPIRGVFN